MSLCCKEASLPAENSCCRRLVGNHWYNNVCSRRVQTGFISSSAISRLKCSEYGPVPANFCPHMRCMSSRGVNWDNFGIWDNKVGEPIIMQQSIKHGIPIPKISVERIGHDSLTGRRPANEDRICIQELRPNLLYVAIFDGHAGAMAVDFVHENLEHHLNFWLEREHDLQIVLRNAFVDLNNKLTRYLYVNYPG